MSSHDGQMSQPCPESWRLAVQQHLASLSEAQRVSFNAPADPDVCLELIVKARGRRKGFARLIELLRPFIEPLKRFEGAIDVLAQVQGGVATPIWGPVRVAVTLASDYIKTLEGLVMILHRIVGSLARFSGYEKLFKSNPAVEKAVGMLYVDLLDFCTRVVRFYTRSSFRAMLTSFDKEFGQVSANIAYHSTEIDWVANAANIEGSSKAREAEKAARKEQLRNNIQRWLSPSTVQDDLYRLQKDYMPGSCDWVLATSLYKCQDPQSPCHSLRFQGRPGAGKTMLASFMTTRLLQEESHVTLYFFCVAGNLEKREPLYVLRTLLSQLLHSDPILYDEVESVYLESGRATADSYVDVRSAFTTALSKTSINTISIIVDALDECRDVDELLEVLFDIQSSRKATRRLHLIATSRQMKLDDLWNDVHLMEEQLDDRSIQSYVDRRVAQIKIISGNELGKIVALEVSRAADCLWVYSRLMMDEIEKLPTKALIQRHLTEIPHGLTQLYTQILQNSEVDFTPAHLALAQQVFLWLDANDYMPAFLSLDCMAYTTLEVVVQYANFGEKVENVTSLASGLCSPLIEIHDSSGAGNFMSYLQDYEINAIHHTADQYIRNCHNLPAESLPAVLRPRRLRQLYRCAASMWYFTECTESELLLARLRKEPWLELYDSYFEMAYGLWGMLKLPSLPDDLDNKEIVTASELLQKADQYTKEDSLQCLRWVELAIIINYAGNWIQLLENAEGALAIDANVGQPSRFSFFEEYRNSRPTFLRDYCYVLQVTGPGCFQRLGNASMPDRFCSRSLAIRMLEIGQKWQYLHRPSQRTLRLQEHRDQVSGIVEGYSMEALIQNLQLDDKDDEEDEDIWFRCHICWRSLKGRSDLRRHQIIHDRFSEMPVPQDLCDNTAPNEELSFTCPKCGDTFQGQENLNKHRTVHALSPRF